MESRRVAGALLASGLRMAKTTSKGAGPKIQPIAPFMPGREEAIDHDLASALLAEAMSGGAEYADLYFEYRKASSIALEDGVVKNVSGGIDMGVGIRAVHGESVGFAYSERLEPKDMQKAAKAAAQIAKQNAAAVEAFRRQKSPNRYPVMDEVLDLDGQTRVELLRRADAACRRADKRVRRVDASLVAVHKEVLQFSSDGRWALDVMPMMRISVSAVAKQRRRQESGSSSGGGRIGSVYLEDTRTPEWHGEEAARVALVNLDSGEAPAGTMPVVLAPGDSGILLHEAVGHGLEADFNRRRTSNYTDRVGHKVASPLVTVIDDPTFEFSRGSINLDDECRPAKVHRLIEKGKLRAYLYDRMGAKYFKQKNSGSGRRESFRHTPMPRMSNTYMAPGQDDPEEIIASVKRGIYAVKFSGGQVNISNGDFVFSLTEGYLIEDGKITMPLKGVNLIGNGPTAMGTVSMVGHDLKMSDGMWTCGKNGQSVPVGVGMPTVRLDELTVGGTGL